MSCSPLPLVDDYRIFGANVDVPAAMSRPVSSHLQSFAGDIFVYGDLYPSRNRSPSGMNDIGFVENQVELTFRHIGSLGSEIGDRVLARLIECRFHELDAAGKLRPCRFLAQGPGRDVKLQCDG